jgi:hypothetical protein
MKNKYFIWSSFFAIYPIFLELLDDGYMSFLYRNVFPMKLADLIINIIINSVYVSIVFGIIFGIICLVKTKFQNIYVWIPIALCLLFVFSFIVGLF